MKYNDATDILSHLRSDHLAGRRRGVFAVCSAHHHVLVSAIRWAAATENHLLVEATANQVNQFGGYTGMNPLDFRKYVHDLAAANGLPDNRLLLGADHLGPHIWKHETAAEAMAKSVELARHFITAGFHKIHLDTGSGCLDDPDKDLDPNTTARRAAVLCKSAEEAADQRLDHYDRPVYVIGAEVPTPGGALTEPDRIEVTDTARVLLTIDRTQEHFKRTGLQHAWERVMAIVVQPGVEFGDTSVAVYDRKRARSLSRLHERLPHHITYEVHSTDYQPPDALKQMTDDHLPLLKVGPCLTFAFREAVFALAHIESEWLHTRKSARLSDMRQCLESVMLAHPQHWQHHYTGTPAQQELMRAYSFRDRIRYYWRFPKVQKALSQLMENLGQSIPSSLISQYFPDYDTICGPAGLSTDSGTLIDNRIQKALAPYVAACL